jgi:hypothetical protein
VHSWSVYECLYTFFDLKDHIEVRMQAHVSNSIILLQLNLVKEMLVALKTGAMKLREVFS